MRHLKRGRKLSRTSSHRKAMVRNIVIGLFEHGKIVTTPAKAKEAKPFAEKLITMAKDGSLASRRRAISVLNNKSVVAQLFSEIAPRYAKRQGGYSRILHLDRHRIGDAGDMCIFELVEEEIKSKKKTKKRAKAAVAPTKEEKAAKTEAAEPEETADNADAPESTESAEEKS